jgi:hypothetical protein
VKLLWFPLVKHLIKQEFNETGKNRERRRKLKKLKQKGRLLLVIDRTDWRGRNLFVASVICGKRALPLYWVLLDKKGSSALGEQIKLLKPVLRLLKPYPVVVMGDREFQGVQLAKWLDERAIAFILRQKKTTNTRLTDTENYQALADFNTRPGTSEFFRGITHTSSHRLGLFNLAIYWKRRCRGQGEKEPWYLLTNLDSLELTVQLYRSRFGIEAMFKDCKTGGYNIEKTKVSEARFLALILLIAIAYSLNTALGQSLAPSGHRSYICRLKEENRTSERHSDFWIGTYGIFWLASMVATSDIALTLMRLKPGKHPYFSKGMTALRFIGQAL